MDDKAVVDYHLEQCLTKGSCQSSQGLGKGQAGNPGARFMCLARIGTYYQNEGQWTEPDY